MADVRGDAMLADNLLRLMEERGWTQSELARRAHMPPSMISRLVCKGSGINIPTARRLKAALGCSWDELLGE